MIAFYTYASLTSNDHDDIAAISNGLSALGIQHRCNAQTVITTEPLTVKQDGQINMICDEWPIANGANLLRTKV
jgi:hypothetical protein